MTDLKDDKELLSALRRASTYRPTAEELARQRVSFILGSLGDSSGVTRDRIQEVLAEREGRKPER